MTHVTSSIEQGRKEQTINPQSRKVTHALMYLSKTVVSRTPFATRPAADFAVNLSSAVAAPELLPSPNMGPYEGIVCEEATAGERW